MKDQPETGSEDMSGQEVGPSAWHAGRPAAQGCGLSLLGRGEWVEGVWSGVVGVVWSGNMGVVLSVMGRGRGGANVLSGRRWAEIVLESASGFG